MRKSGKKVFFIMFICAVVAIQLPVSLRLGAINNYNNFSGQVNGLNTDFLTSNPSDGLQSDNTGSATTSNNDVSIFDDNLKLFLTNISLNSQNHVQDIKVVILFEEEVYPVLREEIIKSVFNDFTIISHYDIISGTYLKLNPLELLSKENSLMKIADIKKIYKSEILENPYILDNSVQLSALNDDDYPNWWLPAIGAESLAYDGSGVRVAVIDTGIYNHPSLNVVANQNFVHDEDPSNYDDDVGHGTHVAGIIGGDGTGSDGKYRGVAPGVSLINARAGNNSGLEEADIINAIDWSSKPIGLGGADADIISMSFGGGYPYISDLITQAITNAQDAYGVIFVASAGNEGPDYFTGSTPASGIDVIAVGATDQNDELAFFSSWGPTFGYLGYPDVVAPGINIISTEAKGSTISKEERYIGNYFDFSGDADYIPLSGTSMSAPMVSGALAILKDAYPNLTPETARIALLEGASILSSEADDDYLKSGAGLINVSASLNYLDSLSPNYNDTAIVYPDNLPIKPYDLLRFPGDHQKFNLTVLSGKSNTYEIEVPSNIQGVSLTVDKSTIIFSDPGIDFVELDIKIKNDAIPGIREVELNLTVGGQIYDVVNIDLDIRLPEYNILMESYHGLNDWFPEFTFNQMGFYEVMSDISEMNISIDYKMEYWTPDYNKNTSNSILTEERLAQYDLVVLQAPILPYSPYEISNLKNYFDRGGNILFLGTRYQDLVTENINDMFSELGLDIQINEENIMNDNWYGIGASVSSQSVQDFNDPIIFNDVTKFHWLIGNSFTVSNKGESIASINSKTVVAKYNGTSYGKGRFLGFGDLYWIFDYYSSSSYSQDHNNLLENILNFLLPQDDASINIKVDFEYTSNSQVNISLYLKDQTSESPITSMDYDSLEITIKNASYNASIDLNMNYNSSGIYLNDTYNLPAPSYNPYSVIVNLTIGSIIYSKSTKILYFDDSKVPIISSLWASNTNITRAIDESNTLNAELDKSTYGNINGFLSIYSYSFFNSKKSINKTLIFNHSAANNYKNTFYPDKSNPSGYAVFYIIPSNENYTNPYSPRVRFEIVNNPPEILKTTSSFNFDGGSEIIFDDVETDTGTLVYATTQGSTFDFTIDVRDSVDYEDNNSNMRIFINLIMASVTDDNYIIFIFPSSIIVGELSYEALSDKYEGTFTIPNSMNYSSIAGTKSVSTAADYDFSTNKGYLGVLYITAYDSEGEFDEFIIILMISERPIDYSIIILIVVGVIALIAIAGMSIYLVRKKRFTKLVRYEPRHQDYYYQPSYEKEDDTYITPEPITQLGPSMYCPFCGGFIKTPKKFCPHCGESLTFNQQEE
ncbi:MAG: S8 family serine peptidase [Candidatus Hodarchaeota archaeon]